MSSQNPQNQPIIVIDFGGDLAAAIRKLSESVLAHYQRILPGTEGIEVFPHDSRLINNGHRYSLLEILTACERRLVLVFHGPFTAEKTIDFMLTEGMDTTSNIYVFVCSDLSPDELNDKTTVWFFAAVTVGAAWGLTVPGLFVCRRGKILTDDQLGAAYQEWAAQDATAPPPAPLPA